MGVSFSEYLLDYPDYRPALIGAVGTSRQGRHDAGQRASSWDAHPSRCKIKGIDTILVKRLRPDACTMTSHSTPALSIVPLIAEISRSDGFQKSPSPVPTTRQHISTPNRQRAAKERRSPYSIARFCCHLGGCSSTFTKKHSLMGKFEPVYISLLLVANADFVF